jgi:hypothetical protein
LRANGPNKGAAQRKIVAQETGVLNERYGREWID